MGYWDDTTKAAGDFLKEHVKKLGPTEPTEKEIAAAQESVSKKPTAAYGRKKQGAGGGFAIIE